VNRKQPRGLFRAVFFRQGFRARDAIRNAVARQCAKGANACSLELPPNAKGIDMFKHILAPTDGSKLSLKAVDRAIALAKETGAKLTVVTVMPDYPMVYAGDGYAMQPMAPRDWTATMKKQAASHLATAEKRALAKQLEVELVTVLNEEPFSGIIATAKKKKCDLIVMASHGRRGLSALILGSETNKVLTHSKIPVLVTR
jgi:nucleotide-binding universal stress UspA family protein